MPGVSFNRSHLSLSLFVLFFLSESLDQQSSRAILPIEVKRKAVVSPLSICNQGMAVRQPVW